MGDRRLARSLSPLRRARGLGEGRRDTVNRALDVTAAGVGLALVSPALAAAAVAIKLSDGGPVFYRQQRVGLNGNEFELLKLRTMEVGAETRGAGLAVNEGDPRITRAGRILRRLSIDELPQLWNVVRGDMSLIGPRPTLAYQVARAGAHPLGGPHRAGRLVRGAPIALARPQDPRAHAARPLCGNVQG
ncbi:MAG: sugar transferase [Actinobacteria bacterium]|nr:MAG: sugar transferase [Actinomycetota bacterium]